MKMTPALDDEAKDFSRLTGSVGGTIATAKNVEEGPQKAGAGSG